MRIRCSATTDVDRVQREEVARLLLELGSGFNLPACGKGFEDLTLMCPNKNVQYINGISQNNKNKFYHLIYPDRILRLTAELQDKANLNYESAYSQLADYFANNCILTPTNANVEMINMTILNQLQSDQYTSISFQQISDNEFSNTGRNSNFLKEFEKEMDIFYEGSFPPHILKLKKGVPVMLLRNLDFDRGMVNGTRLIVQDVLISATANWVKSKIVSGTHVGSLVQIPRVVFKHEADKKCKISFSRKQFPLRLSFAMTIMKSQGQTFKNKVGIFFPKEVYSHGLLYVNAMSRATNLNNLRFIYSSRSNNENYQLLNIVSTDVTIRLRQQLSEV